MLVLSRKVNEKIMIGDDITICVLSVYSADKGSKVRLGIEAPKDVAIHREEVLLRIQEEQNQ